MEPTRGHIVQVNVSKGGVPKLPIAEGQITEHGIVGDKQKHLGPHGGPQKAVCLYSMEVIEALQAEGHTIAPGSAGENITLAGVDWDLMLPGVQLRLGDEVLLEITSFTVPCNQNARWFKDGDFMRMSQIFNPGSARVYARVLQPGTVRPGDPVELIPAERTAAIS